MGLREGEHSAFRYAVAEFVGRHGPLERLERLQRANDVAAKQGNLGQRGADVHRHDLGARLDVEVTSLREIGLGAVELAAIEVKGSSVVQEPGLPQTVAPAPQGSARPRSVGQYASMPLWIGNPSPAVDLQEVDMRSGPLDTGEKRDPLADLVLRGAETARGHELERKVPAQNPGPGTVSSPLGEADSGAERRAGGRRSAELELCPAQCVPRGDLRL